MGALVQLLRFINIFAAAMLSGGQLLVLAVIVPVKRQLAPEQSVEVHQTMLDELPDRYLLPSSVVASATGILLLLLSRHRGRRSVLFTLLGLLGNAGVAITSERFNKPTNRMIRTWTATSIPAEYPAIRDRWDTVHAARTASGLLALASFLAAGLSR